MERTLHHIKAVTNAVKVVAKPNVAASTPVTITQEQLVTLIETAERYLERYSE